MGKRIIFNATNKGGCGKSLLSVHMLQYLLLHPSKPNVAAFDPDYSNLTFSHFFPERVQFLNVDAAEDIDRCVEVLDDAESPADVSLVDGLGSQYRRTFEVWINDSSLFDVAEAINARITYMLLIEEDRDTIMQAGEMMAATGDSVDWLVVLNQRLTKDFTLWKHSDQRMTALALNALEIYLPKIPEAEMTFLNNTRQTLYAASEAQGLTLLERARCRNYWKRFVEQFDAGADYILPSA